MGIVTKAIHKINTRSAKPAPAEHEPKAKASSGQPASVPPPAPLPDQPRKAAGSPAPIPATTVEKPGVVRLSPKVNALDRKTVVSPPAGAPARLAAAPDAAARLKTRQDSPRSTDASRKNATPGATKIEPDIVSLTNPDGPEAELFKLLRTRILFPPSGRPPRTILVTSAVAEEGKSFVAANLAVNVAKNVDEHVLLVDCDLRKPSIHSKFGFNRVKGLSEYLTAGLELASLLLKTGVGKLTLLTSGAPPPNPSELITSSKMAALIEELKARYDDRYIIIDSPPLMMAPETSAIAKWVDGILLVVKYGTPMDLVEELVSHLDREKIIGVVMNKINQREFRSYSYKKYYANSRYYPAAAHS
jgi:exopolysaccharide/PEP-CTERM locus tyrosine autokinase